MRHEESRPATTPDGLTTTGSSTALSLADDDGQTLAHARLAAFSARLGSMARRLIEDALLNEMPAVWERRARQIEAGHPMIGNTLLEQIPDRAEAAAACRGRAELLRRYPEMGLTELGDVVGDALAEQGVMSHGDRSHAA